MLKVTFQFSLKVTVDHSPEFSLNVLIGTNQNLDMPLVTLGWLCFSAHGHHFKKFRRGTVTCQA